MPSLLRLTLALAVDVAGVDAHHDGGAADRGERLDALQQRLLDLVLQTAVECQHEVGAGNRGDRLVAAGDRSELAVVFLRLLAIDTAEDVVVFLLQPAGAFADRGPCGRRRCARHRRSGRIRLSSLIAEMPARRSDTIVSASCGSI